MRAPHVYEYAVIRIVPRVDREEFLNVGIILFSKSARFIRVLSEVREARLLALAPDLDLDLLRQQLGVFARIAEGDPACGPIAALSLPERFRWLTAVRSAILQTSRPHPGLSSDPDATARKLFEELVG
ncbi:MAG: DUF3037 domain-containing protein [Bacteroidia bacterium]|nr:DUF3037 domain-containing protein [Bacteroidia bacterium]